MGEKAVLTCGHGAGHVDPVETNTGSHSCGYTIKHAGADKAAAITCDTKSDVRSPARRLVHVRLAIASRSFFGPDLLGFSIWMND